MRAFVVALLSFGLVGCGAPTGPLPSATVVVLPSQTSFVSAAWATPAQIVVAVAPVAGGRGNGVVLYSIPAFGEQGPVASPSVLGVPYDRTCLLMDDHSPTRLTDGRLADARYCNRQPPAGGPDVTIQVVGLDGHVGPLLADVLYDNPSQFSLDPTAAHGVLGNSSLMCAGIGFFGPGGVSRMPPLIIGSGSQSFRLSDALTLPEDTGGCIPTGNADLPDWSPDGDTIAFLVDPAAVGLDGLARYDEPWELDLAPAARLLAKDLSTPLRTLLKGILHPTGLRWSPNSRWLLFDGELQGHGAGTWLVRASDGAVRQASNVELMTPSWSPDGSKIVGIDSPDRSGLTARLLIVDVSRLTAGD